MSNYNFYYTLSTIKPSGKIVYEYNPLYNYRLDSSCYLKDSDGCYLSADRTRLPQAFPIGKELLWDGSKLISLVLTIPDEVQSEKFKYGYGISEDSTYYPLQYQELGIILDLVTGDNTKDVLNFDLEHPVMMDCQEIYDGSINLIMNDGKNPPRLINTRFAALEKNTYVRTDPVGTQDTNIYDYQTFELDSALAKLPDTISKIEFLGLLESGNLQVGTYLLYFRLCDSDGNASNFIGNTGLIPVFIGSTLSLSTVRGGLVNEHAGKSILVSLTNLADGFDYVKVYYTRTSGNAESVATTQCVEVQDMFKIQNHNCFITVTGFERSNDVPISALFEESIAFGSAEALTICLNRLFLGNLELPQDPYEDLIKLSLDFLPFYLRLNQTDLIGYVQYDYTTVTNDCGYYNPKNVHDYVGYWPGEFYRFGVVYVRKDGSLTGVYNIRGIGELPNIEDIKVSASVLTPYYSDQADKSTKYGELSKNNPYTNPENSNFKIDLDNYWINRDTLENCAGVVKFPDKEFIDDENLGNLCIYGLTVKVPDSTITKLHELGFIGFFIVRQKRIPTVLGQAFVLGVAKYAGIPMLSLPGYRINTKYPTPKVILNLLGKNVNTFTEYITESFLTNAGEVNDDFSLPSIISAPAWYDEPNTEVTLPLPEEGVHFAYCPDYFLDPLKASGVFSGGDVYVKAVSKPIYLHEENRNYYACYNNNLRPYKGTIYKGLGVWVPENTVVRFNSVTFRTTAGAPEDIKYVSLRSKSDSKKYLPVRSNFSTTKQKRKKRIGLKIALAGLAVAAMAVATVFTCGAFSAVAAPATMAIVAGLTAVSTASGAALSQVNDKVTGGDPVGIVLASEDELNNEYKGILESNLPGVNRQLAFIVRGIYGAGLALTGLNKIEDGSLVNIYSPGYSTTSISLQFQARFHDTSAYYSVSSRYPLLSKKQIGVTALDSAFSVFQGDCYISTFTERVIRNFADPDAPTNDDVVDSTTWIENWDSDAKNTSSVNRGDINAAPLGLWVTFMCRTSKNCAYRTTDPTHPLEEGMYGKKRGFYPLQGLDVSGFSKIPESTKINPAFEMSVGVRTYLQQPFKGIPSNKLQARIAFSDLSSSMGSRNGLRNFKSVNYEDYSIRYGGITKLLSINDKLLVVFEHAVGILPVNATSLVPSTTGDVLLESMHVLPSAITIISDMYGSLWADSVIASHSNVYGVDTVAKKIWRIGISSYQFSCISDFAVQSFLIDNITLTERELTPIIGVRNVKTHYNANKQDVMFTYYDNTHGFEEVAWNLCWNELLLKWVTFYSWIPSYSTNIYNTYFSFDRNASKWISKLAMSISGELLPQEEITLEKLYDTIASGVCVELVVIDEWKTE